ncbi:type III secretion system stator protein SctL [Pseudomonas orientalis]|uniref:Type III secretion protein L n=1 Tax=Pseudomonas orientalis TaxID=76758 RepID=A0A1H2H918_9PSED|nr:type III secretion system stator protein SctL [Pseudomonas orientalis]KRP61126.1 type III secretion protein [Pseudomonas orientalis]SDU28306.1 type III secretion protein L [Pseudomonas orientalis]
MLCRYTIDLFKDVPGLPRSVIPREELANWKQAELLLKNANGQAEQLLSLTEEKCEALRERASLEIWQFADAQLKRWERDRQSMCDKLEQYASAITNEAIRRLLDETAAPARLVTLLKQLLAIQVPEVSATLLCHPHDMNEIKQHFAYQKVTVWKVQADEKIPPQTLVLKTDEGDFHISWNALLTSFLERGEAMHPKDSHAEQRPQGE